MALVDRYAGVIFDYGGVLASHQTPADTASLAAIAGVPQERFEPLYWIGRQDYDKALTTADQYWDDVAKKCGLAFSSGQRQALIDADVASWVHFDDAMYAFAELLSAGGIRIAVLSNMPRELGEFIKAQTPGFAPFEHLTLSYETRSAKPEPAIYEHCLAGLGLPAAQTLFLDDRIDNVRAAERMGIHAMLFTSREEILPRLTA